MLRRTKEGVRSELSVPRREEMTRQFILQYSQDGDELTLLDPVYVPLSPVQRFWYKRLLTRADNMTLSEIFKAPAASLANVATDAKAVDDSVSALEVEPTPAKVEEEGVVDQEEEGLNEGESQAREHVKQAMANTKAGGEGNAWMKMMNLLMQLRKVCNHP